MCLLYFVLEISAVVSLFLCFHLYFRFPSFLPNILFLFQNLIQNTPFGHHISLAIRFSQILLFKSLTVLKINGQILGRMSLHCDLPDIFLMDYGF